ncbi:MULTISPECIES: hypothetical protein [Acinetobacter]|jgi:hypothetical protein|uniref:Uncharacterized protein n=1 Tax=Acinetobacter baumannii TaxID=470 RepID=A0A9Q1W4Y6_ACIBA|nr:MULTISPECIES: hypothetical protein [Acinetobacter]RQL46567.1 hypothetical protein BJI56_14710 [Acinetobacter nosocomialis]AGQ07145.1 hypothetical protein BJAB0715_02499 [Acinetobacter baumannii BJAB0715]AIL80539.1 hypothetical protein IX87_18590 [Acinetobacter baumannii]AIS05549.1 hypothetical protein LX00_03980 [Acinetobacter baumannii]AMN02102.1 hypothetical protein AZE33_13110 [Acinetobacter baumannii]
MTITNTDLIDDDAMSEKFHVVYDGKALEEHLMDVRDLAPAMMAISDLLTHANKEINGDKLEIQLNVKANFKTGCFGIEFVEHLSWVNQIKDLLVGPTATALANASGILGLVGFFGGATVGVIQIYKKLKGNPPVKIEETVDHAKVFYTETEYLEVDKRALRLYRSKVIASDIEKMLEPLSKDGIDSFYVVKEMLDENVELFIDKKEVEYFKFQDIDDHLSESITETFLQIESISFKEKNKWRFNNGGSTINASITDEVFLQKIDSGLLRFGKGDLLKVKLKTIQFLAHTKLKTEFEVMEVIEHKTTKQEEFDF